ncbi:MAG: mechanosensitive ion channel family protein [Proteobacteria bacterium]|nr:mechanosensitive ion channel family protein [Pseudomonadota bacterium]MCG2770777.1 mechanosensitive ion channel family protein [Desulfobacterales bacterium]
MKSTNEISKQVGEVQKTVVLWWNDPLIIQLIIAVAGLVVIRLLAALLTRWAGRFVKDSQARYRIRKVSALISYLVIILFLAVVFRERLGGLAIALGVAGVGIAFALQEVVTSIAGWAAINFANFYKTGDRIQLGGIKGDVIDIGILRTTLMELGEWVKSDLYTGRIVRIANSFVFKEPVFNYSGDFPFLWDEITVPVTYASDHRLAREILEKIIHTVIEEFSAYAKRAWKDIVKQYMVEEAMIDPVVTLVCTDNWIEFTVRYITDFKLRRSTKDRLFSLILEEFEKTGGRVKIASTTVQLVDPQPLTVKFNGKLPE